MGQFSDITICDLFLMLFFLSRTNPVAKMGIVYNSFQKEQLSETLQKYLSGPFIAILALQCRTIATLFAANKFVKLVRREDRYGQTPGNHCRCQFISGSCL